MMQDSCSHKPYITEYRHAGVAHRLMEAFVTAEKNAGKKHISLTCKEALIGFYESFGYTARGISDSVKG